MFLLLCYFIVQLNINNICAQNVVFTTDANEPIEIGSLIPEIIDFIIETKVSNRFAETTVSSFVENQDIVSQQTTFSVVLPENAMISDFYMNVTGVIYNAHVTSKEDADHIYGQSVSSDKSAAHVFLSTRYSNRFTINANIAPQSDVSFHLTYEELLERENGVYEIVINVQPGQIIPVLKVKVFINEDQPLKFVKTPNLRSGNNLLLTNNSITSDASVQFFNSSAALVVFHPNTEKQLEYACSGLGGSEDKDGFLGQFIVQYDIDRNPDGADILYRDGYFINYFAPTNQPPLLKHIVFVLDSSGSMSGLKMSQLKDAMNTIIYELNPDDYLHVIDFSGEVYVWSYEDENSRTENNFIEPVKADEDALEKIENIINNKLVAEGWTDILAALTTGLNLVTRTQTSNENYKSIIIFLTDGEPTWGELNTEAIINKVLELNTYKTPIFSLSFGDGANKTFLHKLSHENYAHATHIYEGSDAAITMRGFYKKISNPTLKDVSYQNLDGAVNMTKSEFPMFFNGSELVVAGQSSLQDVQALKISATGRKGDVDFSPKFGVPLVKLDRIWAYLTVKQLLADMKASGNMSLTTKILDIALSYSLVTEITSLIVVKPNSTVAVNMEDASIGAIPKTPEEFSMCENITAYIIENKVFIRGEAVIDETTTFAPTTTTVTVPTTTELIETTETSTFTPTTVTATTTTEKVVLCYETQFGCCHDNITKASGLNFTGCDPANYSSESCSMPKHRGNCGNFEVRWYYDTKDGRCLRFHYGGCGGNENRFGTLEACRNICVYGNGMDRCKLPGKIAGPCSASKTRWSYNQLYGICNSFQYGGCIGNANNFETKEQCLNTCREPAVMESKYEACSLDVDYGTCSNYTENWFFDKNQGVCKQFWYSGCEGNENRFATFEKCNSICVQPKDNGRCLLPKSRGPCESNFTSWYFDKDIRECREFYYGGCYGNNNRFGSNSECLNACKELVLQNDIQSVCSLPQRQGRKCKNYEMKWGFNIKIGSCRRFWYGGCEGNMNRFDSEEDCSSICVNPSEKARCHLPKVKGNCKRKLKQWYYDKARQKCISFKYGGCNGNNNRFQTKAECEQFCY